MQLVQLSNSLISSTYQYIIQVSKIPWVFPNAAIKTYNTGEG